MSAIFDILIVLILAGSIFAAAKKGFVKSIIGLAGVIVAIIIAVTFSPKFGGIIDKGFVKPFIKDNVVRTMAKAMTDETNNQVKVSSDTALKSVDINNMFNSSDTPQFAKDILNSLNLTAENAREQLTQATKGPAAQATMGGFVEKLIDKSGISIMISKAIAFFILFIVVIIFTKVVEIFAGTITKLPVLKQSDKLLGACLGVVNGLITIFILCIVIKAVSGFIAPEDGTTFSKGILDKTVIFKFFYNFNPFQGLKF